MFTSIDKAIIALIMALVYLINELLGIRLDISVDTVERVIMLVTPILVWAIPNKTT